MANVAYVRVSTKEQNEERQIENLKKYDIDRWYTEKVSGKDTNRPQLQAMLDYVREGDTVYIHDFSRLARNTADLLKLTEYLDCKGVKLISTKENLDTSTPTGKLMLTMIGAIAEFERANLKERQAEGIALAKEHGKYKGRKAREIDEEFISLYNDYMERKTSKYAMAKALGVSRPTIDRMIERYKAEY